MLYIVIKNLKLNLILKAFAGAIIMTLYDLIMEPTAVWLNFWNWETKVIPFSNYITWFCISLVFMLIFLISSTKIKNKVATTLLLTQTGFFLLLTIRILLFPI